MSCSSASTSPTPPTAPRAPTPAACGGDSASPLRDAGVGVSELALRRPTLDDVFLQLTGAPPSEDGAAPAVVEEEPPREPPHRHLLRLHLPSGHELVSAVRDAWVVTGRN